jgi:type II secretory pathway component PulC
MILARESRPALAVAAFLIVVVGAELSVINTGGETPSSPIPEAIPQRQSKPLIPDNAIDVILSRPLFVTGRRSRVNGIVMRGLDNMPRLTGIIANSERRVAVFQPTGEKPKALKEGDSIGGWTIRSIGQRQVVFEKNGGMMTIEPSKNSSTVGAATSPAPQDRSVLGQGPGNLPSPNGRIGQP